VWFFCHGTGNAGDDHSVAAPADEAWKLGRRLDVLKRRQGDGIDVEEFRGILALVREAGDVDIASHLPSETLLVAIAGLGFIWFPPIVSPRGIANLFVILPQPYNVSMTFLAWEVAILNDVNSTRDHGAVQGGKNPDSRPTHAKTAPRKFWCPPPTDGSSYVITSIKDM
jgi:hypothetical protein